MKKPKFPKHLFWDVDYDKIDWVKYADWVIMRVFERGDVEDIRLCRKHYGDKIIKNALLNTKYFSQNRIHLASAIINEPLKNFQCYIHQQLNPTLFPF